MLYTQWDLQLECSISKAAVCPNTTDLNQTQWGWSSLIYKKAWCPGDLEIQGKDNFLHWKRQALTGNTGNSSEEVMSINFSSDYLTIRETAGHMFSNTIYLWAQLELKEQSHQHCKGGVWKEYQPLTVQLHSLQAPPPMIIKLLPLLLASNYTRAFQ